jgi:hypothetical protein
LSLRCAGLRFPQKTPTVCSIRLSSTSLRAIAVATGTWERTIPTHRLFNRRENFKKEFEGQA